MPLVLVLVKVTVRGLQPEKVSGRKELVTVIGGVIITSIDFVPVQPLASVTVTMYVFAVLTVMVEVEAPVLQ